MDLNLYPVFVEIMRHRSVSKAAEVLGLTQPATSNALSRLRQQLGDPLFVRTGNGMLPTHFAKEVLPRIERSVAALRDLQGDGPKDLPPVGTISRHFKIVMSDLEETLFLPKLIDSLASAAPEISVEVRPFQRDRLQKDLEAGHTDFVVAHLRGAFKNVVSKPLTRTDFVCLARKDHPGLNGPLTLADYTRLGHILVAPDRGGTRGVIDVQLKTLDQTRRVVCSVPHFLSGCVLAAKSDHLLTVPRQLGEIVAGDLGLELNELPFAVPGFSIGLHWHWTRDSDPEHASFRNFVLDLLG